MTSLGYDEQVDWLFHQFPVFQKQGESAYKPTLENTKSLLQYFHIPIGEMKFVHVAGTNGKGTTCSMIASILTESGKKTGLFTSPHIRDFRERIRINGVKISKEEVVDYVEKIKSQNFDFHPSFFEISWAIALAHFYHAKCEIIIAEAGIGGRLDATNVISPILSVITNVGLDHVKILGNTRSKIAKEKAGIIKKNTPILIGEGDEEINSIFKEKAELENSPIYFLSKHNKGPVQETNKKLAYKAIDFLEENNFISVAQRRKGIKNIYKNTGWNGRYQIVQKKPLIIADAAHNPMGIEKLIKYIQNHHEGKKVIAIYGASNDKDLASILPLFPLQWEYYFTEFPSKRSYKIEDFKNYCAGKRMKTQFFFYPKDAISQAKSIQREEEIILLFGSFYLLEEII